MPFREERGRHKNRFPGVLALALLLSGCGISVVPRPQNPDARVNPADRSITEFATALKYRPGFRS